MDLSAPPNLKLLNKTVTPPQAKEKRQQSNGTENSAVWIDFGFYLLLVI